MDKKIIIVLLICFFCFSVPVVADNFYYYSENAGWLNFKQIQVSSFAFSALSGWVWAENIGWINLSPSYGGVSVDGQGKCFGYGYSENVGWINFNPTGGGVKVRSEPFAMSGWAWAENIGWIRFDSIIVDFNNYKLRVLPNYVGPREKKEVRIFLGGLDNPAEQYRLIIITVSGNKVKDCGNISYKELNEGIIWPLTNDNGDEISTGLYIVTAIGRNEKFTKKFYFKK